MSKLGLTSEIYKSSKKFTEFIHHTQHPISSLTNIWPKTKTGFLKKSQKDLNAWVPQYKANPLFKTPQIRQWLNDFFILAQGESLQRFLDILQTHIKNLVNDYGILWARTQAA